MLKHDGDGDLKLKNACVDPLQPSLVITMTDVRSEGGEN